MSKWKLKSFTFADEKLASERDGHGKRVILYISGHTDDTGYYYENDCFRICEDEHVAYYTKNGDSEVEVINYTENQDIIDRLDEMLFDNPIVVPGVGYLYSVSGVIKRLKIM